MVQGAHWDMRYLLSLPQKRCGLGGAFGSAFSHEPASHSMTSALISIMISDSSRLFP